MEGGTQLIEKEVCPDFQTDSEARDGFHHAQQEAPEVENAGPTLIFFFQFTLALMKSWAAL